METALQVLTDALIPPPPTPSEVLEGFIPWLRKQDASVNYNYDFPFDCAFSRYMKSIGLHRGRASYHTFSLDYREDYHGTEFPEGWATALGDFNNPVDSWNNPRPKDHTYGGLLSRLEKHKENT